MVTNPDLAHPDLAKLIDHTLLSPNATSEGIARLCQEARECGFASVCVNPGWVKVATQLLEGSEVRVCTVIGFPLGATTTWTKVMETRDAITNGADEVDMVLNIGALKSGDEDWVREDIASVVKAADGRVVKVILETGLLTDEEKVKASLLAKEAGASFVKTCTGFGPGSATVEDIALLRKTVGKQMGVKASGGVKDYETARRMIEAGANRIGTSSGVNIVKG